MREHGFVFTKHEQGTFLISFAIFKFFCVWIPMTVLSVNAAERDLRVDDRAVEYANAQKEE